jgi:hypothetical protein
MLHLGQTLKKHIETNGLLKTEVAKTAGITYNYLSIIFNKQSIDCALWEKLCLSSGLDPAIAFSDTERKDTPQKDVSDDITSSLRQLLDEKERTIQILLNKIPLVTGTKTEQ